MITLTYRVTFDACTYRIDSRLLQIHLPAPDAEGVQLLICGPEGMVRSLCGNQARDGGVQASGSQTMSQLGGSLKELGYKDEQVTWL